MSAPRKRPTRAATITATFTLEQFYTGMALAGLLASQAREPNKGWVTQWATEMGRLMAAKGTDGGPR
jgi:hypothetical protein